MTRAEKRAEVFALLRANPTRSNSEIAREVGVSHTAVATMRRDLESRNFESFNSAPETFRPEDESFRSTGTGDETFNPEDIARAESFMQDKNLQPKVSGSEPAPTPLDEITTSIPRADWRETGLALAKGESVPAEIEALVAELADSEREALGLALIKRYREPPPKKPRKRSLNPRHQSESLRTRVIELRRQGHQFQDIAALLNIPPSSARAIIQHYARDLLVRHPMRTTAEQRDQVIELRKSGLLYSEIAARLGLNLGTVRSIGLAAGLSTRNTKAR
jgi:DNA-binding NarL/FixJ family response regulator